MSHSRRGFLGLAGAFAMAPPAFAKRGDWVLLGTRRISLQLEQDVIYVGMAKGLFTGLRLKVTRGDVFMERLRVRFVNNDEVDLPVRNYLRAGDETRAILLPSLVRGIKLVDMIYRRVPGGGEAHIAVFGREA